MRKAPYAHQVGITGKSLSPKAYLAFGISGSGQHIAGMKNSNIIVSINTDANAAIFDISDYTIIEDAATFIKELIESYKENYE